MARPVDHDRIKQFLFNKYDKNGTYNVPMIGLTRLEGIEPPTAGLEIRCSIPQPVEATSTYERDAERMASSMADSAAPGPGLPALVGMLREHDAELAELVERWPSLPAAIRAAALAMARAAGK